MGDQDKLAQLFCCILVWGSGEIHPRTLVHVPSNVSVFSFPYQANPTPTTHTPSREPCHPIVGRALPSTVNYYCINKSSSHSMPISRPCTVKVMEWLEAVMMLMFMKRAFPRRSSPPRSSYLLERICTKSLSKYNIRNKRFGHPDCTCVRYQLLEITPPVKNKHSSSFGERFQSPEIFGWG